MKANKIVLGTVQLGFNHGIANKKKKNHLQATSDAFGIIKYLLENGISYIDTVYSYGNSEIIIGKYLNPSKKYKNKVNIITNCLL